MNQKRKQRNRARKRTLRRKQRLTCSNCGRRGLHWVEYPEWYLGDEEDAQGFWTCPKLYDKDGVRKGEHDAQPFPVDAGMGMAGIIGLMTEAKRAIEEATRIPPRLDGAVFSNSTIFLGKMMTQINQTELEAVAETEFSSITFLNMTGDLTITWDSQNDEKIKALVKKKLEEGWIFYTMRKVVIEKIQIKRKVGLKGVDTIKSLIIEDKDFEKLVADMNDRDLAEALKAGTIGLGKRKDAGKGKPIETARRLKSADDILDAKGQSLAMRPLAWG